MMRWKRVLRFVLASLVLALSGIAVILLANAWRFKSKQLDVLPISRTPLDDNECAARLAAAIQFLTVSHDDPRQIDPEPFLALHEFLEQAFPLVHRNLKREIVGNLSLLFTWEGTDASRRPVLLEHTRRTIGDDRVQVSVSCDRTQPSPVANVESVDFNTLHRTIREVFPDVIVAPGLTAVSTDSRHYDAITDNTFRFIPMRVAAEDLRRIHGRDERIPVENYLEIIRFFIQQIRNSAS